MNYEEIEAGRRRNWDKLKPPEVRRAEEKAKREAELKAAEEEAARLRNESRRPGDPIDEPPVVRKSFFRRRAERMSAAASADMARYRKMRNRAIVALFCLGLLFAASSIIRTLNAAAMRDQQLEEYARYTNMNLMGEPVQIYDSPFGALESWRSAWLRHDAWGIWNSMSPTQQENLSRAKPMNTTVLEYQQRLKSGHLDNYVDQIRQLEYMEVVRLPGQPWRHGELAIFRTRTPIARPNSQAPMEWIVAASWSAEIKQWRVAEFREAPFFSIKWTLEGQILPRVGGMRAVRFNRDGSSIETDVIKQQTGSSGPGTFTNGGEDR